MNTVIKAEEISFNERGLKKALEKLEGSAMYDVQTLVYYPYLFHEFKVKSRSVIKRTGEKAGCTVDGINKLGALIDIAPKFTDLEIDKKSVMPKLLTDSEALEVAERFLFESIASRIKILKMPSLELIKQETFHRPYWIVEGRRKEYGSFYITVDAVTGKYHPI